MTEKICKKCGRPGEFREGRNICKACRAEQKKIWREANPEYYKRYYYANHGKIRANAKRWYDANPEKAKRWQKANPEKRRAIEKRWIESNPEKVKAFRKRWEDNNSEKRRLRANIRYKENSLIKKSSVKRYQDANPEKEAARHKRWRAANPEKCLANRHSRRARVAGNGGRYTAQEWKDLCNLYGNRCLSCGRTDVKLTVDHVIPIKLGGVNTIENLQPLCKNCNSSKGASHRDYRPTLQPALFVESA